MKFRTARCFYDAHTLREEIYQGALHMLWSENKVLVQVLKTHPPNAKDVLIII